MAQLKQQQTVECKMKTLEPHAVQMVLLPRACTQTAAGVVDRHRKKQVESSFAIIASTKALAAVAIESEGWRGYSTLKQPPALAADGHNNTLQELFTFTAVVFFTRIGMHTKKRVSVLYNNNTVLYNAQ